MEMYGSNVEADNYNVTVDGYQMIMEDLTSNESFNRRETIRHNIIGGTQTVMRGNYVPRDFTFTTHLLIVPEYPDVYDDIIREWQSKPIEIISNLMGGKFNAELIIKKSPSSSPNYLNLEVQVKEIPDVKSLIPNDEFIIPAETKAKTKVSSSTDKNTKNKNNKKNTKDSKNKNKKGKNKNKKGKNITKTK